jgi:hypothetical protein
VGRRHLSPLTGHPLDDAIIRRVSRRRQGCALMTQAANAAILFAASETEHDPYTGGAG